MYGEIGEVPSILFQYFREDIPVIGVRRGELKVGRDPGESRQEQQLEAIVGFPLGGAVAEGGLPFEEQAEMCSPKVHDGDRGGVRQAVFRAGEAEQMQEPLPEEFDDQTQAFDPPVKLAAVGQLREEGAEMFPEITVKLILGSKARAS